jgi:uncharacterized protein (DUF2249 family)
MSQKIKFFISENNLTVFREQAMGPNLWKLKKTRRKYKRITSKGWCSRGLN